LGAGADHWWKPSVPLACGIGDWSATKSSPEFRLRILPRVTVAISPGLYSPVSTHPIYIVAFPA
jgi:hypothetical protein